MNKFKLNGPSDSLTALNPRNLTQYELSWREQPRQNLSMSSPCPATPWLGLISLWQSYKVGKWSFLFCLSHLLTIWSSKSTSWLLH